MKQKHGPTEVFEEAERKSVYHRHNIRTFASLYTDKRTKIFEENLTIYGHSAKDKAFTEFFLGTNSWLYSNINSTERTPFSRAAYTSNLLL